MDGWIPVARLLDVLMDEVLPARVVRGAVAKVLTDGAAIEPQPAAVRLAAVLLGEGAPAEPEGDENDLVPLVPELVEGTNGMLRAAVGGDLSPAMHAMIDSFDDRFRSSPFFVQALNEAADAGVAISENAARMIADRIRELEAAEAARGDVDGG